MKEITILSGKGGTGKTSFTAALASVAKNAVLCDNDVDASDLHLLLQPKVQEFFSFESGSYAIINNDTCTECGVCFDKCRFNAIDKFEDGSFKVNNFLCEGCRLCERICPTESITTKVNKDNSWYVSSTRYGVMVHAKMGPGEENSGRLVSKIRSRAKDIAKDHHADFIINDGPPGIGCAAISSISGTNLVVLVTEPTKSGLNDAERLVELVKSFQIPVMGIINKADINISVSEELEKYFNENDIPLLAKIPFDKQWVASMVEGKTLVEYIPDSEIAKQIKGIWNKISEN